MIWQLTALATASLCCAPTQVASFEAALRRYVAGCLQLGAAVLRGIALGLQLPESYFEGDVAGVLGGLHALPEPWAAPELWVQLSPPNPHLARPHARLRAPSSVPLFPPAGDSYWVSRILYYPPLPTPAPAASQQELSCGEHTGAAAPPSACLF